VGCVGAGDQKRDIRKDLKCCGIYKIKSPSNKIYIGQSRDIDNRFRYYRCGYSKSQPKVYNSIKKHGIDRHEFIKIMTLQTCCTQQELDYWEQFFIDLYRNSGFEMMNLREAGHHGKMSDETRKKQSVAKSGKYTGENNPNYGKGLFGIKNGMYGKKHSKESIDKMIQTKCDRHGHKRGLKGEEKKEQMRINRDNWKKNIKIGRINAVGKRVVQYSLSGEFIAEWRYIELAAEKTCDSAGKISRCCYGRPTPTAKFYWRFKIND